VSVGPDGNLVASGGQDQTVRLFDLERRSEVGVLEGHKKAVSSIVFFPDGYELASAAMESRLIIWSIKTGKPLTTIWGARDESFASVQVYGGGRSIACALADGRIRLWVASG
jgi:WD40 repeat protein